jgi:hypothetical protein
MAEYSRMAQGLVSSLGGATPVVLPFEPDFIELDNFTSATTPADTEVPKALWYRDMGQGAAIRYVFNATPVLTTATTAAGGTGFSTFSASTPVLGAAQQIVSISTASPAVVTVTGHGFVTGDVVIMTGLRQSATTGMQQIAGFPFVVTVTGANTFTIPWNTNQSNYTALAASPTGAVVRQVLFPYLYFPGVSLIAFLTTGATTTISTTANHNLVVGSQVAFRVPEAWGTIELNTPTSLGQPVYGVVTAVNSAVQVVVNVDSSAMTAFDSNPTFAAALAGLTAPQMVAVGDRNTGEVTNAFLPITTNGPTIGGSFQANTRQGFIIGAAVAGTLADQLFYRAYLHDLVQ